MPYFSASARIQRGSMRGVVITDSSIITSTLDMNFQNITSVKDPMLPQDAATRKYVDKTIDQINQNFESFFAGYELSLSGVAYSDVIHLQSGSYLVTVTALRDGYPTAVFAVSKGSESIAGHVQRLTATPGLDTKEMLDMQWPTGGLLMLRKTGPGYDGDYRVDLSVKNVSAVPAPPVLESDAATKGFVEKVVRERLDVQFGGVEVNLVGACWTGICNLMCGSYFMSVKSLVASGAPTATFMISKNHQGSGGSVFRPTSNPGVYTPEELEVSWPPDSLPLLRKTGAGYNGRYLVDLNLKNFSTVPPPVIENDTATVEFVRQEIAKAMDIHWGGVKVHLKGVHYSDVMPLRSGSYILAVTSLVVGGPTATFSISKGSPYLLPSMVELTQTHGMDTHEKIELVWPPNGMLMVRKTGVFHDGEYIVDMNLKNATINPALPELPTDIASKDYVIEEINHRMQAQWGGIQLSLISTNWTSVSADFRVGAYIITVIPMAEGGPTGIFLISKSTQASEAHVACMTPSAGHLTLENIEIRWPANERMQVRKDGVFHDGLYVIDANLKNFTTAPPPELPNDIATKGYVETLVRELVSLKNEGYRVTLTGTDWAEVLYLKAGSYSLTINPLIEGGPTASFTVAKSAQRTDASVSTVTGCPAIDTGDVIQVIWSANEKVKVRKTGITNDGTYVVNVNQPFSHDQSTYSSDISLTQDTVREHVINIVKEQLEVSTGGSSVWLSSDEWADVAFLNRGSYLITISPTVVGGPSGSWSLNKSDTTEDAMIVRIGHVAGRLGECTLDVMWARDSPLRIRKRATGATKSYDGRYIINFDVKNFTALNNTNRDTVDANSLTRDWVEHYVQEQLEVKFSGVVYALYGIEPVEVLELLPGAYMITVSARTLGGPSAVFQLSKSSEKQDAHVVKTAQSPGEKDGCLLDLTWPTGSKPLLRKTGAEHDGPYLIDFNLKRFALLPPGVDETEPTNIPTVDVVQRMIEESLRLAGTGNIQVALEGTNSANVVCLQPGSYVISVAGDLPGSPTATFNLSKSSHSQNAHIVRMSSAPGHVKDTQLELCWNDDSDLVLRKSTDACDGVYTVTLNCAQQFPVTLDPPPSENSRPIETERKEPNAIRHVALIGAQWTDVDNVSFGAYVLTVSPDITGGPTGTFHVAKNDPDGEGHVVSVTSLCGMGSDVRLELVWDTCLRMRKTGGKYDGMFRVVGLSPPTASFDMTEQEVPSSPCHPVSTPPAATPGHRVTLLADEFTEVVNVDPGSYFIAITPNTRGPTATFAVSKSFQDGHASIFRMTSLCGEDDELDNHLELHWAPGEQLKIRKTGTGGDGIFTVSLMGF